MRTRTSGFTATELILITALIALGVSLYVAQARSLDAASRDDQRKTAVHAIDYALRHDYFASHQAYPRTLSPQTLPAVDEQAFVDPAGHKFGSPASDYRYEPAQCSDADCQSFVLRATLEREADLVIRSDN